MTRESFPSPPSEAKKRPQAALSQRPSQGPVSAETRRHGRAFAQSRPSHGRRQTARSGYVTGAGAGAGTRRARAHKHMRNRMHTCALSFARPSLRFPSLVRACARVLLRVRVSLLVVEHARLGELLQRRFELAHEALPQRLVRRLRPPHLRWGGCEGATWVRWGVAGRGGGKGSCSPSPPAAPARVSAHDRGRGKQEKVGALRRD